MDIEKIINEMTLEEKVALVSGTDFMYTNIIPRLNIKPLRMSDGPHGLRVQFENGDNGVTQSEKSTAFHCASTTASSWNPNNLYKMGKALGEECLYYGVNILLGPAVNIKRNPLCGRNFEYFSEDPFLSGKMGEALVKGVQEKNVGVSVKHFALNNSENYRFMGDSVCDLRAIREIYLKGFEIIVKEAKPLTMMAAYNKINGTFCSENKWLLTDVLHDEWGFNGFTMTDWGGSNDRVKGIKAMLDLEMPGDTLISRKSLVDGINSKALSINELDRCVYNILKVNEKLTASKRQEVDFPLHDELASEIAIDSAVLMKNNGVLPLKKNKKYFICGDLFTKMRYQGAGSSLICPTKVTTPKEAFDKANIDYEFYKGYSENKLEPEKELIEEIISKSKSYDSIILFLGLTDYVESEGAVRIDMSLPKNQLVLIDALIKENKKIVVVLFGGSPVELPFFNNVEALLNMYLPGQNGGTAVTKLLFGEVSPSGKLAETWVKKYEDVSFFNEYGNTVNEIYKENIFVGYRYYLTASKEVLLPFGYGLSYTTFEYKNLKCKKSNNKIILNFDLTNTGKIKGAEIAELYVKGPESDIFKPLKELKAFKKVYLEPNETQNVELEVSLDDLRYFNTKENRFVLENGSYEFQVSSDSKTIKLKEEIFIAGEKLVSPYSEKVSSIYKDANLNLVTNEIFEEMSGLKIPPIPNKKPITIESHFKDLNSTFFAKILYNSVLSVANKKLKEAKKMEEGPLKDNEIKGAIFLKRILESNSLRTMSMTAGKNFPYNFAEGFVALANGKLFKGAKCFLTKIKAPKLPKEGGKENDE